MLRAGLRAAGCLAEPAQGMGLGFGLLPCLTAPWVVGGQHWGALPEAPLPIATTGPLSISRHITTVDEVQVMPVHKH